MQLDCVALRVGVARSVSSRMTLALKFVGGNFVPQVITASSDQCF